MPIGVRAENLSFTWPNGQVVLRDCSLAVPAGQFWMVLGTNGSGKSTLLRILAGLLVPQAGRCELAQPVGYVFQNPDHQLVMPSVAADVALSLGTERLSATEVRQRVNLSLNLVDMGGFQQRPIYALSGGQKQRVALAGALAHQAQVLLLDEPTALLDPESQFDLVKVVRHLVQTQGITALWVTHRLEELDYCDGGFVIHQGQVVFEGRPAELRAYVQRQHLDELVE